MLFLCVNGGPSHVDSFDYKPELAKYAGKGKMPTGKLMAPVWGFNQRDQSGLWIRELFPQIATHADKLCLIHSMKIDVPNNDHGKHAAAVDGPIAGMLTDLEGRSLRLTEVKGILG